MAGNTFGQLFRITTFGESHGKSIGVVIDGCPAGIGVTQEDIQKELDRRRPGQSHITTRRNEQDRVDILSGIFQGKTLGSPIALLIHNTDKKSSDYAHLKSTYRPSHADYTYEKKYGHRDYRGGGRSSARETAARVAAGAIAKKILEAQHIDIKAYVSSVGNIALSQHYKEVDLSNIDSNIVRCPDTETAHQMIEYIDAIRQQGDTVGGVVACVVQGCPVGLGEPVFDKLHADLGKAMLSINAVKGFEYGSGFSGTYMKGSEHNDLFEKEGDQITTQTNYSGGIQGGISNGMDIYFRVAFKPVATIMQPQKSIDSSGETIDIEGKGRHDPCVLPRAVPIVEAMTALVLTDHLLRNKISNLDTL